ncbi:MAG: efflux RND transporter periplasmic adaptor subunit [Candidatus Kryptoniota bacterium]
MANKKNKNKKIFVFSGAGILLIILIAAIVIGSKKEPVIIVQTEKVSRRTITQVVTASGNIQPEVIVKITPEVSGEIIDLPVVEGQKVKKGQLLVKIRPDTYVAQLQQSQAYLQSQMAAVQLSKANYQYAEATYKRMQELYKKQLASDQDLENSKTQYEVAKAQYESARANVDQAQAQVKVAEDNLRKTTIHSPMDGIVSQLNSKLGERVVGTSMMSGTEIMDIADLGSMEAQVNVDENDVVLVAVGDTAILSVDAYPNKKIKGVVYQIATTGTTTGAGTQEQVTNFLVKIHIVDRSVELRPGMSVTADIETATHKDVLAVPIQSVTIRTVGSGATNHGKENLQASGSSTKRAPEKTEEVVFIVKNGVAKMVPVKRGISDDNYTEILSGLKGGEEVVSGSFKAINRELSDGSKVRIENNRRNFATGAGE